MPDEGLQEIQLRGKQLVFLAMSATVVAVVIFLCGVMVGRGVPTVRQAAAGTIEADADVVTPVTDTDAPTSVAEVTDAPAAPLEYPDIVSDQPTAERQLKTTVAPRQPFAAETAVAKTEPPKGPAATTAVAKPAPVKAVSARAVPARAVPAKSVPATKAADTPASGGSNAAGFQVQVAAYQRQGDATTVRDRLARKGYPAFVATATTSAGTWYRVRVGGYETRNEAQAVATRLKREEQLEPWVTR